MEDLICARLGGSDLELQPLVAAIAGHHGGPPRTTAEDHQRMRTLAGPQAAVDARAHVEACLDLWPQAGLLPAAPASGPLFPASFVPRPMQKAALEVPLRDGPMLAFVEDETGAGKTEAALLLAQRMLLAGKGRGLHVALPTMATADAMFDRARRAVRALFTTPPSLTLAHGRAAAAFFSNLKGTGALLEKSNSERSAVSTNFSASASERPLQKGAPRAKMCFVAPCDSGQYIDYTILFFWC